MIDKMNSWKTYMMTVGDFFKLTNDRIDAENIYHIKKLIIVKL
jgi:hypothetical protein